MRDQAFARLLTTLDTVPAGPAAIPGDASGDFAEAQLRLRATQRRLGACVQESPYLAFARRLVAAPETATPFAASA